MKISPRILATPSIITGLLTLANPVLAEVTEDHSLCRSPMLYATNIRPACEQYGANGMASLYQHSEFITGIRTTPKVKTAGQDDYAS